MRVAGFVWLSLTLGFGFVACASGGAGTLNDDDGGSPATHSTSTPIDSGRRVPDARDGRDARDPDTKVDVVTPKDAKADTFSPGKVCVSNCHNDSECQTSCPASPFGVNCCDTASGVCYASSSSCGLVDAGFD